MARIQLFPGHLAYLIEDSCPFPGKKKLAGRLIGELTRKILLFCDF
jgi:hypothetical protein